MNDDFILYLTDLFFSIEKKNQDGFMLIGMSVPVECLYRLYERLILVDVPAIETLPEDVKLKFWKMAKKYNPDSQEQSIKASKAAYILNLITSS